VRNKEAVRLVPAYRRLPASGCLTTALCGAGLAFRVCNCEDQPVVEEVILRSDEICGEILSGDYFLGSARRWRSWELEYSSARSLKSRLCGKSQSLEITPLVR